MLQMIKLFFQSIKIYFLYFIKYFGIHFFTVFTFFIKIIILKINQTEPHKFI